MGNIIDWIIGGVIIVATILIVLRSIIKFKNGKGGCNCNGCDLANRNCPGKKL